jgi:Ca2+-binding EF-hand superfamily protein
LDEDDPAIVALREKQAAETRAEQEMLAQQMGLSVEEMVALDAAASEGTEDAIQEYMEAFQRIDQDGSGSLSPDELRQVMGDLGEDMNEQELEDMIKEADRDGDGEIDYD